MVIQNSYNNSSSLYLIPTPIGNMEDITIRALNILKSVDIILCEDTRTTGVLLKNYDIKKKLVSCHEYNEDDMINYVISRLSEGNNLGLVTDQGSPVISDPGFVVARGVINAGYNVISLPGATAFVPALSVSGIEPSPFLFYGFLNAKSSKQKRELEELKNFKYTIIFYESVHRIKSTLENILDVFGNRNMTLCREISKIHEEIARGKISDIIEIVDGMRGEFVLVIEGNKNNYSFADLDVYSHVRLYVDDGMSEMDAIKKVSRERGVAKSVIYSEYHRRK